MRVELIANKLNQQFKNKKNQQSQNKMNKILKIFWQKPKKKMIIKILFKEIIMSHRKRIYIKDRKLKIKIIDLIIL